MVENRFTLDDGDSVLTLAGWQAATGQDGNSVAVTDIDGLFVDSPGGDFHRAPGPAADAGGSIFRDGFESEAASMYPERTSTWRLTED